MINKTNIILNASIDTIWIDSYYLDKKDNNGIKLFFKNIKLSSINDLLIGKKEALINELKTYTITMKNIIDLEYTRFDDYLIITIIELDERQSIKSDSIKYETIFYNNKNNIVMYEELIKNYKDILKYETKNKNVYMYKISMLEAQKAKCIKSNLLLEIYV